MPRAGRCWAVLGPAGALGKEQSCTGPRRERRSLLTAAAGGLGGRITTDSEASAPSPRTAPLPLLTRGDGPSSSSQAPLIVASGGPYGTTSSGDSPSSTSGSHVSHTRSCRA